MGTKNLKNENLKNNKIIKWLFVYYNRSGRKADTAGNPHKKPRCKLVENSRLGYCACDFSFSLLLEAFLLTNPRKSGSNSLCIGGELRSGHCLVKDQALLKPIAILVPNTHTNHRYGYYYHILLLVSLYYFSRR
jgi:hypothetical protein